MCLWFSKAMLLWLFSDVPDAPDRLVLSEHKSKSVKLRWSPGDDHNSSTTGKKGESVSAGVNTYSILHTESVLLALNGISNTLAIVLQVYRFVSYSLVLYKSIIYWSKHELGLVSLRIIQAQSTVCEFYAQQMIRQAIHLQELQQRGMSVIAFVPVDRVYYWVWGKPVGAWKLEGAAPSSWEPQLSRPQTSRSCRLSLPRVWR